MLPGPLGQADDHRDLTLTDLLQHRLDTGPVQGFSALGQLYGAEEAGQASFGEHQQIGVASAGCNGFEHPVQVISGVAVTACQLYQFNVHF